MAVCEQIISTSLMYLSASPEQSGPFPKVSIFLQDIMASCIQCKPIHGIYGFILVNIHSLDRFTFGGIFPPPLIVIYLTESAQLQCPTISAFL